MQIIVGSTALERFNLNRKKPVDIDIWSDIPRISSTLDSHIIPLEILKLVESKDGYATPNSCYTIKCSHATWDIKWEKTKLDILWLKSNGCKLLPDLYCRLVDYWKIEHGNKEFLSLNQDKKNFFNDHVTYMYDHDWLHELVAYPNVPIYKKALKDGQSVLLDKKKFDLLSYDEQIRMFREEITVIAIERWVVNPSVAGKISWYKAYKLALRKTITNLTKNWASEFLVQNLDLYVKPDFTFFNHALNIIGEHSD